MEQRFIIEKDSVCGGSQRVYMLSGYFLDNTAEGTEFQALLDGEELSVRLTVLEGFAIYQKYRAREAEGHYTDREYSLWIQLPARIRRGARLEVFECREGGKLLIHSAGEAGLKRTSSFFRANLEECSLQGRTAYIRGWAAGSETCQMEVLGSRGEIPFTLVRRCRTDVAALFPELYLEREPLEEHVLFGFEVSFELPDMQAVDFTIRSGKEKAVWQISGQGGHLTLKECTKVRKYLNYIRENGAAQALRRRLGRNTNPGQAALRPEAEKNIQGTPKQKPGRTKEFAKKPLISIVVPLYRTEPKWLTALADSVRAQTWEKWEFCLSDGSGAKSPLREILREMQASDPRIRVTASEKPLGIADNTNEGIRLAKGEYIAFADHDDLLDPQALYECVRAINRNGDADLLYTDEDKISMDGTEFFQPHFKPDFNLDMLRSMNYICHMTVVKRDLLEEVGYLDDHFDGAQDYDLVLRCAERAKRICHVPGALYHWRAHRESTAENPRSKQYAFRAGRRALQAHINRLGISARVEQCAQPGLYRTYYDLPREKLRVSAIVSGSEENTKRCREALGRLGGRLVEEIRRLDGPADADALNEAAGKAAGDYLLFLDARLVPADSKCIRTMASYAARADVGAVGGLLSFGDGTVCQAGTVIGRDGRLYRAFEGSQAGELGYFARIRAASDLSAVPVSCMMVKRQIFQEMGGFDRELPRHYFDADFCLRLIRQSRWVVYLPFAEFISSMPMIRKAELTKEGMRGYERERAIFLERWGAFLENGDPNYNPNLQEQGGRFRLSLETDGGKYGKVQ